MCAIVARQRRGEARTWLLPALRVGSNRLFHFLNPYHTSPDSGECQYKSRTRKRRIDPYMRAGDAGPRPESGPGLIMCASLSTDEGDKISIELMTSDRKLKASREGSKGRDYGT